MDFLDLCERTADYALQEAQLRRRRALADDASADGIDRELEEVVIEKRFALRRALDWQAPGTPPAHA